MARCGCETRCNCFLDILDSETIDFTKTGDGSTTNPYVLSAVALVNTAPNYLMFSIEAEDSFLIQHRSSTTSPEFSLFGAEKPGGGDHVVLNFIHMPDGGEFEFQILVGQMTLAGVIDAEVYITNADCTERLRADSPPLFFTGENQYGLMPMGDIIDWDVDTVGTLLSFSIPDDPDNPRVVVTVEGGGCYMAMMNLNWFGGIGP